MKKIIIISILISLSISCNGKVKKSEENIQKYQESSLTDTSSGKNGKQVKCGFFFMR